MVFEMELCIWHLYPALLNMYGDVGNIKILKHRAEARGITVSVHALERGEAFGDNTPDIMMLGSGQAFEMQIVAEELRQNRALLSGYIENDGVLLAIGSGFQLLGNACIPDADVQIEGLSLLPIRTEPGEKRFVGNVVVETDAEMLVGFENHAGKTFIDTLPPLGAVRAGFGNNGEDGMEGVRYKNVYGTFLHGPLLSKNPALADAILGKALEKKYGNAALSNLDDTYAHAAKQTILSRLGLA